MQTLIVFSHLRWNFVYQRPQHLLSRLAQYYSVVFVEEPIFEDGDARLVVSTPASNVHVYTPHTPVHASGFHDDQISVLQPLISDLIAGRGRSIVWFYTPMALPLLKQCDPDLVVYDCMDELSAFANAPKQLLQRESALLNIADLVFTGGPSLYQAKRHRTSSAHCFASSVDVTHFEQALDRSNGHALQADIGYPRLGYYGVIDERLDLGLIDALADTHPEWQLVMVGPVVKIDSATLPRRPNIHYLGQQPYQALPHFLAGWDVCLMPFALNDSTRYISPTKSLEYMAAELPIVSTPVRDVVDLHSDVVAIAETPEAFVAACEAALLLTVEAREEMIVKMRDKMARTSWRATALAMRELMSQLGRSAPEKTTSANFIAAQVRNVNQLRSEQPGQRYGTVVIGAGPTGLSAAYHLDTDTLLLESNNTVGGWCRSIKDQGFTFDYAGHIMFSNDPYVLELYQILLGDNLHWQNREAWVYSKGVHTRYPFQGALYGLPPKVITECISGAIEARYGGTRQPDTNSPAANCKMVSGDVKDLEDCCADGSAPAGSAISASQGAVALQPQVPRNFEEFIYKIWGAGIAKHFAIPYNRKLWTVPLAEMETSWLGGRVPLPNLDEIIEGALEPVARPMGPNARFGYPKKGGFEALMKGFTPHIKGTIETSAKVAQVTPHEKVITLDDGRRFHYDQLVSTMPLPELVRVIGENAPAHIHSAARGLRHISIRCVNLGIARANITDKHWIYYPEDSIFHRIFVQGNASPNCNPPGGFGLTCEISYSEHKPLPVDGDALVARCMSDLVEVGLLAVEDKLITSSLVDMPYAYVLYDHARAENVSVIRSWMLQHDIILAGRYSEWEYYNSDHAFLAGRKAALAAQEMHPKKRALVLGD